MKHLRHLVQWWSWRRNRAHRLAQLREIRQTHSDLHFRRGDWLTYDIIRLLENRPRKFQPA